MSRFWKPFKKKGESDEGTRRTRKKSSSDDKESVDKIREEVSNI